MKAFDRIDRPVVIFCKAVVFITFIVIIASAALQVFYRFILDKSFSWTDELCRYGMVWMTFIGAGYAVRTHQHIAVDLLKTVISPTAAVVLDRINDVCMMGFGATLAYFGGKLSVMNMAQISPGLKFSMGLVYSCVPICGVLILAMRWQICLAGSFRRSGQAERGNRCVYSSDCFVSCLFWSFGNLSAYQLQHWGGLSSGYAV